MNKTKLTGLGMLSLTMVVVAGFYDAQTWANPAVKDCQDIRGEFNYYGQPLNSDAEVTEPKFDGLIFRRIPIRGSPHSAKIAYDAKREILAVELTGEDLSPQSSIHFEQRVTCKDEAIVIIDETAGSSDGIKVQSKTLTTLSLSEDKSLIVDVEYKVSREFIPFVPSVREGKDRFIFHRLKK